MCAGKETSYTTAMIFDSPRMELTYDTVGGFTGRVIYGGEKPSAFSGKVDAFGIHEYSLLYSNDNKTYDYWAVMLDYDKLVGVWTSRDSNEFGSFLHSVQPGALVSESKPNPTGGSEVDLPVATAILL